MIIHVSGSVRDVDGAPLAAIAVSNGEHIVQTDGDGEYAIEADPRIHPFILLTVPDTHRAAHAGYVVTPEASGRRDFVLEAAPSRADRSFVMAQISDTHVIAHEDLYQRGGNQIDRPRFEQDLAQLEREAQPDLILNTGDLTNMGYIAELEQYRDAVSGLGVPIYSQFGGHDGDEEYHLAGFEWGSFRGAGATCTRNYERLFGPVNYSFDWGGRHFVFFGNEEYMFSSYTRIRMDRWLWADLDRQPPEREIVVAVHWPPPTSFLDRLARFNVVLVLYGHTHASKVFSHRDMLVATPTTFCFGGTDSNPRGYRVARFAEPGGFEMEFCPMWSPEAPRSAGGGGGEAGAAGTPAATPASTWRERWHAQLPGHTHRAAPVPFSDDLLMSVQDEDDGAGAGVCRLSGSDGSLRWHAPTDASVRGSVVLADGRCVGCSVTGRLTCWDTGDGSVVWQVDTPGFPERWLSASPVVGGHTVYVGAKSGYAAYELDTGEMRWDTRFVGTSDLIADAVGDKWGCYATPQLWQDLLIAFVPRRGYVAMRADNGRVSWEQRLADTQDYWPTPQLHGDLLIGGGEDGRLTCLEAATGEVVWHRLQGDGHRSGRGWLHGIAIDRELVVTVGVDGVARCSSLDDGTERWSYQTGPDLLDMTAFHRGMRTMLAAPAVAGELVYLCGVDGWVSAVDRESGAVRRRMELQQPVTAPVVALDDGLCVATWDGHLYRLVD